MSTRVLLIDDDPKTTRGLRRVLETASYTVREENDSTVALEAAREFQPDVVILDYQMPTVHGGDVAWQLSSDSLLKNATVILCTAYSPKEILPKLPPARIPILEKPVNIEALLKLIDECVRGGPPA